MRYNGMNAAMQSMVNFAAPAAAGAIFSISTLRMTLLIDIVTAILGTCLLSCLALPQQNAPAKKTSIYSDMKLGVKYAFSDQFIGKLLGCVSKVSRAEQLCKPDKASCQIYHAQEAPCKLLETHSHSTIILDFHKEALYVCRRTTISWLRKTPDSRRRS